jgi:error-prone DNA polymerase
MSYAELACMTNFSFLRGASHPEEMVAQAMALGLSGLGIADRNSVAGVVRAHVFAREHDAAGKGFRVVSGTRLVFADGTPDILAYPRDRPAWGRLCRLLTQGNLRARKGECTLYFEDLQQFHEGLQFIVMETSTFPTHPDVHKKDALRRTKGKGVHASVEKTAAPMRNADTQEGRGVKILSALAPGRVWVAARFSYDTHMRENFASRISLARTHCLPLIAVNEVNMHGTARRPLADALACIREGVTIEKAGRSLLAANAESHLKSPDEMARLFTEAPEAIRETQRFLAGISFSLDQLRYDYPQELREGFASEQDALEYFTFEGASKRYPQGVPEQVIKAIRYELAIVAELHYAAYFLTVHDIVRYARERKILCQGRGSAANSSICFCLGITEVDPSKHDLLFERFISAERREPPDIDVDFEHERREEVMQYIYNRYGRDRAGLTATVISYRSRSSLRDMGKVFGVSEETLDALSRAVWGRHSEGVEEKEAMRVGVDPHEPRLALALKLAQEIAGFPRHLSQHTGGFVITHTRLDEVVPIAHAAMQDRTTVEWDKDDLDALGILKIDILALGMLSCLRRSFEFLEKHYDRALTLATIPAEEKPVYDMISKADTIGVFQIESRAQMSMLPRLRPREFYDLVIEVAIVRPGPIQGDMVHPYLRRRQKLEPVEYPSPELESVLGKTLGVPLFQEQAMKIAIVAAGFTPSEADKLRRAMATFKRVGTLHTFHDKMVEGMVDRGYEREFASRCFKQIEGFGSYGFPESHAASFALLVYASAWFKCFYPEIFAAALINSQPMGFYAPAQILRDARNHGVAVREVDVNFSDWDCTLENGEQFFSIRLGFRIVKGVRKEDMLRIMEKRARGYDSVRDLWLRTGLSPAVLERLAVADAFRSIGLDRREALWAVRGLNRAGDKDDLELFRHVNLRELEPDAQLPPMPLGEHVVEDYRQMSLSLKAHPLSFLRSDLAKKRALRCGDLGDVLIPQRGEKVAQGRMRSARLTIAGLVIVRQRPGTAKGVIFMTLEDETGSANVIVWPKVFETFRPVVIGARFVAVTGRVQNEQGVIHVIAEKIEDMTPLLGKLSSLGAEISGLARADEVMRPQERDKIKVDATPLLPLDLPPSREPPASLVRETARVMPKGRNFH